MSDEVKAKFPGNPDTVRQGVVEFLKYLGEDPNREGLKGTPDRVVKSYLELFSGYLKDPKDVMTVFSEKDVVHKDQIILLKNIEFYSTCEHHLLPFIGVAHLAYIPSTKVIGISKLARILEIYARRLQIQERIGDQVTMALMNLLEAEGAACIIESKHLCINCRGIGKQNALMVTSSLKGAFLNNLKTRQELLTLIKN